MFIHKLWKSIIPLLAVLLLTVACGGEADPPKPTYSNTPVPDNMVPATAPATKVELHFAIVTDVSAGSPKGVALVESMEQMIEERHKGVDLVYDITYDLAPADAEVVVRELAQTGNYEIVWAIGEYQDTVKALAPKFHDLLWAISSSTFKPGDNAFWIGVSSYEAAYLLGATAGLTSDDNTISAITESSSEQTTVAINAYLAGAQSVNADASLVDEAALVYDVDTGILEKDDTQIGNIQISWNPVIKKLINAWNSASDFSPLEAPEEHIVYGMKDGAVNVNLTSEISQDTQDAVENIYQQVMNAEFEVPFNAEK